MNSGAVALGLVNGLNIGFPAVGLVLVYRANGFLNLADAQFGVESFSTDAQNSGYRPEYAVSDLDNTVSLTPSTAYAPQAQTFNNALGITNTQYRALSTPGVALSAGTAQCDAILKARGAAPAESGDGYTGAVCSQFSTFVPTFTRDF